MRREATAMTVRRHLGEILNQVQYRGDSVVVTKDGKPVAALVDYPLYERILALRVVFDALSDRIGQTYAGIGEIVAHAEIHEAVRAVREQRRR
jgi:prevent-host-death family protein